MTQFGHRCSTITVTSSVSALYQPSSRRAGRGIESSSIGQRLGAVRLRPIRPSAYGAKWL
jgi:hypothetical protein